MLNYEEMCLKLRCDEFCSTMSVGILTNWNKQVQNMSFYVWRAIFSDLKAAIFEL